MAGVAVVIKMGKNLKSPSGAGGAEKPPIAESANQRVSSILNKAASKRRVYPANNPNETMQEREERAAIRLQLAARSKLIFRQRLHRENLSSRLTFEWHVLGGACRLLNQIMVFALLLVALELSGDSLTKRGIFHNLKGHFDFEALQELSDRKVFVSETMKDIATKSKDFFILSSQYFEADGGSVELVGPMETFTEPTVLGGAQFSVQVPEFSLTCWVKTVPQFTKGYIIRKRFLPAGYGSELACWGWHLTDSRGQALHYGAHDYFSTSEFTGGAKRQEQAELSGEDASPFAPETFALLTMVVGARDGKHVVTFYRNLELQGSVELTRPITDCFNNLEGVLVGDAGLTLGQLRWYPRAMTPSSIEEIYGGGAFLADISTGSSPISLSESELAVVRRGLKTGIEAVEQSVLDQQPRAELDAVLQSAEAAVQQEAAPAASPDAPGGMQAVNATAVLDAVTGRRFVQLMEGPATLSKPEAGGERFFDPTSFPDWSGTGLSLTLWYRPPPCSFASCGTFIISSHPVGPSSSARCYTAWIETQGVYFDNPNSAEGWHYKLGIMDSKFYIDHTHWRHIAFVWDENTDDWIFYQDGVKVYSTPWGSSVKETHCSEPATRVTMGARFPGWTYGIEIEVYDWRAYVGAPLSQPQIQAIAFSDAPALGRMELPRLPGESAEGWTARAVADQHLYRCTPLTSERMMDLPWKDLYGHDCSWYFNNRAAFPNICQLPEAAQNCPIACKSLQECFSHYEVPKDKIYFVWDSIRRVEAQGSGGTLCLGSDLDPAELVRECEQWRQRGGRGAERWERDMRVKMGRRVNLTDCAELAAAIDPHCAFDAGEVRRFTEEAVNNGGDYTVAFWMKPIGEASLSEGGRFFPHLNLVSTFSPPLQNLGFSHYSSGINGEARIDTACVGEGGVDMENIELQAASDSDWTFVSFVRVNSTYNTVGGTTGDVATNLARMSESAGSYQQCLFNPEALFSAMEINYPVLLSPVMLIPSFLPFAKVQELYYDRVGVMSVRQGPLVTNAEREATEIEVAKRDYAPRSVLMAAPIIFTTRVRPTSDCPYEYAAQWLEEEHARMRASKCAAPFRCEEALLQDPARTMACRGALQEEAGFFGLEPQEFRGKGFADLLFSITDSPFLFRAGKLLPTQDFVDSLTDKVLILLVFFTPQYGITTVMEVSADFSGPHDLRMGVEVAHYRILEKRQLTVYVVVQCLVLGSIVLMLIDVLASVLHLWMAHTHAKSGRTDGAYMVDDNVPGTLAKASIDLLTVITVVAFVILRLPSQIGSAGQTESILGKLSGIPWASNEVAMAAKKEAFFGAVQELLALIGEQQRLDTFLNVILLVSLLRIIQCTSLHPRLALLTGTLAKAMDDFWHAAILIVLMMASFAFIGTWRFGAEMEEFGSFERSMQTEFMLMFGEFIEGWSDNRDLQAFVVLYYMVMFMLVLNFLLAIIVEAYMGVREANDALPIEQEFFTDVAHTFYSTVRGFVRGWPLSKDLGLVLSTHKAKLTVGFVELHATKMFHDQRTVGEFLRYYSAFEFCDPPHVSRTGVHHDEEERRNDRIARKVCEMMNVKPAKLKDLARDAEERKQERQRRRDSTEPHSRPAAVDDGAQAQVHRIQSIGAEESVDRVEAVPYGSSGHGNGNGNGNGNGSGYTNGTSDVERIGSGW